MGAPKRPIDIERLINLYQTGHYTCHALGKIFEMTHQGIHKRLQAEGVRLFSKSERIDMQLDAVDMVGLYRDEGYAITQLASDYGHCAKDIKRYLVARGVRIRNPWEQRCLEKEREAERQAWLATVTNVREYF